jgi:hypothetical protein
VLLVVPRQRKSEDEGRQDGAGRGEGDAGDLRLAPIPVERVVGEEAGDDERPRERDAAERKARLPFAPELRHVDLGSGQKGEDDAREGADEREPVGDRDVKGVSDDDAERELDQRDRQSDLHRERARHEDRPKKDRRYGCITQSHNLLPGWPCRS